MVKQLGIPTFFMALSCADLRLNELILIISKLRSLVLNKSVVLVARHFQYHVKVLFEFIALNGPLGKTQYYTIRVKFQVKSSFHFHSFICILSAHKLFRLTKEEYATQGLMILFMQTFRSK